MQTTHSDACFKAFNNLCEKLTYSELVVSEEFNYWVFERGYMAALQIVASSQNIDDEFLDAAWSTQPSLEQDFALH